MDREELKKQVQNFMGKPNINDYNTTPPTPYRVFVDEIQERIAFINTQPMSDEARFDALSGALLSLLGVDPDADSDIDVQEALFWADNEY